MVRAAMFASCFAISLTAQQSEHTAGSPRAVSYDRDVRPILADRCFACHGPDETSRKADLRLDLSEHATALREHAAAIVARDANASEAWRRITSEDDDDRMPPKSSGKPPLSQREREIVRAWIEQGAVYEPHWSFVPPTRPATPVETPNAIDAFVRAELRTHQLQPSERAAPEIQLRRLFLALTGLPPEPGDIAAFCKDPSDTAYAQWITRIFTEEPWRSRYAERMATPWLDSARYADTSGIHMDAGRQIWPFRDWVLEAYRSNMPFDAFVRDQIAGDLWPDATVTQKVASGFHRCHVTTDEGGAIDAEYLVEYAVDRVATTGSVFLGLTLGCARCHDHKYDPISQEDFYGLYAYFASIEEPGLYSQIPDANRALEPFLRVPSDAQLQQEEALKSDLAAVQLELDSVPAEEAAEFARWRSELLQEARVQWPASQVTAAQSQGGADLSIDADGTVTASGKNPDQDVHVLTLRTDATSLRMLHLMALPAPDRQDQRVGRAENGNAVLQSIEVDAVSVRDPQQKRRLSFTWAWADVEQGNGNFHVVNAIASDDGVGWAVDAHMRAGGSREALFVTDEPFGFDGGTELQVTLRYDSVYQRHTFARVRVQLGQIDEQALERLPEASGGFHVAGPFVGDAEENWSAAFGPETALVLDKGAQFLSSKGKSGKPLTWRHREGLREDAVGALPAGANATFVARTLWAPTARKRTFSLGSDDGFRLYASGKEVAQNRIDRGAQKDQDSAEIELTRGPQLLTMRIVNTGGEGGFYQRSQPRYGELTGELVAALLPATAADADQRLRTAWRRNFSKSYLASLEKKNTLSQQLRELDTKMPRTMVMKEREQRRPTYVLARGQYDQPIKDREIPRTTPKALGTLPEGAPRRPPRSRAVDHVEGQPAVCARAGEPTVRTDVRRRHRAHERGLRHARRVAEPHGLARLARGRVPRMWLRRAAHAATHRDQRDVPPRRPRERSCDASRRGQPLVVVVPTPPSLSRTTARPSAVRVGPARGALRRTVGQAIPAAGLVAGSRNAAVQHARVRPRLGRCAVPPQSLHLPQARMPAAVDADLRPADARSVRDPACADQHADAGLGALERRAVRRSCAHARSARIPGSTR